MDTTENSFFKFRKKDSVSQVSAVCRVVLMYEARVVNSLLGNCNFGIELQCWV